MSSTARHVANYAVTKVDRLYVDDTGSEADPAIHIANDNGIYSETGDDLSFSVKGVKRMKLDEFGLYVVPASILPTLPSIASSSDTNTGIYWPAANELAIATDGAERLKVSDSITTSANRVLIPAGTIDGGTSAVTPGLAISNNTGSGLYAETTTSLGIAVQEAPLVRIDGGLSSASVFQLIGNNATTGSANTYFHARARTTRAGGFLATNNSPRDGAVGTVQLYFGTRYNGGSAPVQAVIQFNTTAISGSPGGSTTTDDFIRFDNTNGVTIAKNLRLPTSGGTASALNYYEEYSATAQVLGSVNGVNVFTTTVNTTVTIVRVGKHITIHIDSFTGTMAFNDLLYVTWPVRFGCLMHNQLVACTVNGVASTQVLGNCFGGSVTFTKTIVASNFNATEVVNIFATAFPVVKS
jgi:hypothetical protein